MYSPLMAFDYEIRHFCMVYVEEYDISPEVPLQQASQDGRGDRTNGPETFRNCGVESNLGSPNCGRESGRSCSHVGSTKDSEKVVILPPALRLPRIEDGLPATSPSPV